MSSCSYRFIFPLNVTADIPTDFLISIPNCSFDKGIFLPQDDKKWFTERPDYPARLLLLNDRRLSIISHPDSGESAISLSLDELSQIEAGQNLLFGWIEFRTKSANYKLTYNTRASLPLDCFMAAVRRRWLSQFLPVPQSQSCESHQLGQQPGIKFRNMLSEALDANETAVLQYFAAPLERRRKFLGFARVSFQPGHLFAVTSMSHLLWLKDEYHGSWGPYAGILVSAPLSLLQCATIEQVDEGAILLIRFLPEFNWRISLTRLDPDCVEFVRKLNRYSVPNSSRAEVYYQRSMRPKPTSDQ